MSALKSGNETERHASGVSRRLSDPSLPWPSDEKILADLGRKGPSEAGLTMSQAHSEDYLQGWNDCHAHMAEEVVRLDDRIEKLREGILAARREGCACDFHLFGQDEDLLTDEALDHYQTLEQQRNAAAGLLARVQAAASDPSPNSLEALATIQTILSVPEKEG